MALLLFAASADAKPTDFQLHGYGTAYFVHPDWETDPGRRDQIDLERLTLYPSARLSERVRVLGEIEFEHGGTGSTLEFDRFEEFGEFEQEIEKGGEVSLEQLNLTFLLRPNVDVSVGRVKVPFGLAAMYDEPSEYRAPVRSEMESSLIPVNWYEDGLQLRVEAPRGLVTRISLVNGLDSSGFSSGSWVARGHQLRFETVAADDFAWAARVDYQLDDESIIGASAYYGNSSDNRPKPDLAIDAHVMVLDAHARGERGPLALQGVVLYGELENSDQVSRANRNLSNNLNVKRTPVGSAALGYSIEAACDLGHWIAQGRQRLDLYVRHDFYDSMYHVEGEVFDNPRWERTTNAAGLNWEPAEDVVLKGEYSRRELGLSRDNIERTTTLGIGFEF